MNEIKKISDENFDDTVKEGVILVDFYAEWCGPCKMLSPILEEIVNENEHINIGKVNVDESSVKSKEFEIRSIPTLIFFKDGEPIETIVGSLTKKTIISKMEEYNGR